jgi:uncharacterized membrane protein YcaP (DUF421 family)
MIDVAKTLHEWIDLIFGGDFPDKPLLWYEVAARTIVVYLAGLMLIRLGKSRLLSRTTPLDIIVGFILGSVLSRAITGSAALSGSIVSATVLVALHWFFTGLAFHSHWWGRLIKGHSYVLVEDGQIHRDNLKRSHISENDLLQQLRQKAHIDDLADVKLAVKERSGEISVIKRIAKPKVLQVDASEGVQTIRIILQECATEIDVPHDGINVHQTKAIAVQPRNTQTSESADRAQK